ncbi:MAG: hypothetical protein HY941_00620 [Gammaproteobacteria bacterium]|nr:hypothetical protein [Gammaproteobacteria bacterium]
MNSAMNPWSEAERGVSPHPNDVDRKRIERALAQRQRYRYVSPYVRKAADGYRIESPCCSRNVDQSGGVIDIARLEYLDPCSAWRLYRKDHLRDQWVAEGEYTSLTAVLQRLNEDPQRLFWR